MSDGFIDPYLDPDTGVLHNLVGARTPDDLRKAEADLVSARMLELRTRPVKPSNDLAELCAIHFRLFQDVYPWAGQVRFIDIHKQTGSGAESFLPFQQIERAAGFAAVELAQDKLLRGLKRRDFIRRLAYHYDAFNYIHPFREGNGRTQRVFWSRVARDAGWQLQWQDVTGSVNDDACRIAVEDRNLQPLEAMFARIVTTAGV